MDKRIIALNTIVSYARSLLGVALNLFSTRWILAALGKEDLGLYYAVGGVVVFLGFINTSMAFSAQRNFAYALGHGGEKEVNAWFNTALILHVLFACVFLILSVPLGKIAFAYWLKIPESRISASIWVYAGAALSAFFAIFSVPYNALYIAKQHIYELTIIQTLQTVSFFLLAYYALRYDGDRLVFYAMGMLAIHAMTTLLQTLRCKWAFPESRINFGMMFSKARFKGLAYFSGWGLTSTFAYLFRGQGIALLLNNFGTSGTNAAYGIANSVSGQVGFLSNAFINAISPEIIKMEGEGNHKGAMQLGTRACKLTTFLILFLLIPLMTDVEPLLELWLKNVPEYTSEFVRIMFVSFLAVQMVLGLTAVGKGYGKKIALPEIVVSVILLSSIPIAYGAILAGMKVYCIVGAVALTAILTSLSGLYFSRRIFGYPVKEWIKDVFCRNMVLVVLVLPVNLLMHHLMDSNILRLFAVTMIDGALLCLLGWFLLLAKEEKMFILQKMSSVLRRQHV